MLTLSYVRINGEKYFYRSDGRVDLNRKPFLGFRPPCIASSRVNKTCIGIHYELLLPRANPMAPRICINRGISELTLSFSEALNFYTKYFEFAPLIREGYRLFMIDIRTLGTEYHGK